MLFGRCIGRKSRILRYVWQTLCYTSYYANKSDISRSNSHDGTWCFCRPTEIFPVITRRKYLENNFFPFFFLPAIASRLFFFLPPPPLLPPPFSLSLFLSRFSLPLSSNNGDRVKARRTTELNITPPLMGTDNYFFGHLKFASLRRDKPWIMR